MRNKKIFSKTFLVIVLLLTYLPIISLVIFSFNSSKSFTRFEGFSFKWYAGLFQNQDMMYALLVTIIVAVISTVVSTIVGTFAAISLAKQKRILKDVTMAFNNLPIINPEIITAISLFVLFGTFHIPSGYFTIILAHIAFSTPYVIITVYPKIKELDPNLSDAAADLGATPLKTLFLVVLPQIKVSVIAAAAIAFTMSFDDFVISYFASGASGVKNISIYLYTLKRGINPEINALSTIIVLLIGLKITYDYFIGGPRKLKKEELRG